MIELRDIEIIKDNAPFFNFEKKIVVVKGRVSIMAPTTSLGIDPGTVNLGIALYKNGNFWAQEIKMFRGETTNNRISQIQLLLNTLTEKPVKIIIEGASYGDKFRQTELQDIRAGAVAWAMNKWTYLDVAEIVPPLTIRKAVFGSGKIKNPWHGEIPDNAAAALGCALYPIMKEKENDK